MLPFSMGSRLSAFHAMSGGRSVFANEDSNTRLSICTCVDRLEGGWVTYLGDQVYSASIEHVMI